MHDPSKADTAELQIPFVEMPFEKTKPLSSLVKIDFGALSDIGKVRSQNEDAYVIYRTGRYWEKLMTNLMPGDLPERFDENGYAMAVADGMGGAAGGEVASNLAIQVCINLVLQSARWALRLDDPETREEEIEAGKQRAEMYFRKIDAALLRYAENNPWLKGMGTTLTGAYSNGNDLFIIHIGDSRAYLFRQNRLTKLTQDHTLAQLLVRTGDLTAEEALSHRLRHTLTSCLGGRDGMVQIDIQHRQLQDGDVLMLCTDGLTDMVREAEIAEVLSNFQSSDQGCQTLVDLALEKGGKDNITVILARYSVPDPAL